MIKLPVLAASVLLATAGASPALAAPVSDGTSNTIQVAAPASGAYVFNNVMVESLTGQGAFPPDHTKVA